MTYLTRYTNLFCFLPFLIHACQGLVPDFILRRAIRALLRQRLREIDQGSFEANFAAKMKWIEGVRARNTIADETEKANEQHYEVISSTGMPRKPTQYRDHRFRQSSFCQLSDRTQSTRPVCIPQGRRHWWKQKYLCWKAIARKPNSRTVWIFSIWDVVSLCIFETPLVD